LPSRQIITKILDHLAKIAELRLRLRPRRGSRHRADLLLAVVVEAWRRRERWQERRGRARAPVYILDGYGRRSQRQLARELERLRAEKGE